MPRTVALIYTRKSMVRRGQPDPTSPEMQEAACLEKAKSLKLKPELYSDIEGRHSGTTENREAWQRCRSRLGDPDVSALIVYAWGRAVRNTKLLLQLIDDCRAADVRFISVSQNIDSNTADGLMILTITAAVDAAEAGRASERRIETIDYLRRHKGRFYGIAPFGTSLVRRGDTWVLVPSEKPQTNGSDHSALKRLYEMAIRI